MPVGYLLNRTVLGLDRACSRAQLRCFERSGSLVTIFTHGLFLDEAESWKDWCYPQQRTTVEHLRRMIVYFQSVGYRFVSPLDLLNGLDSRGKHALLTFDDGYFNNQRALPLMEQYNVPALFFVTASLVEQGKAHWWDVLYRARRAQGVDVDTACREIHSRIAATTEQIETQLTHELGVKEFKPIGDTDRVFTSEELREFARHPKVFIGNHCWTHAFLPAYSPEGARAQIVRAQDSLQNITGKRPLAIGYPCGGWTPEVLQCCGEAGLRLGFSTIPRKEYLPTLRDPRRRLLIGRFGLWGNSEIERQCEFMRSDLMWHLRYGRMVGKLKRLLRRSSTP